MVLNGRQSEHYSWEVLTQLEVEQPCGLFSLLTTEFMCLSGSGQYHMLQRKGQLPKIPKDMVRSQVVAGINAIGPAKTSNHWCSLLLRLHRPWVQKQS